MAKQRRSENQPIMTQDQERYMAFMGLIQWTQAVVRQSERLREVTGRLYSLGIVDPFLRQEVSLAHHVECHFFSISANKVIEYRHWVTNLGLCRDVDFSEIDQFSKDDIKDLRDMREHIIEYFQGEGHKRKRWFIEPPERPGGIIDASSVIDTIIGGRLDWVEFSGAAERLLPLLLAEPIPYPPRINR